MRGIVILSLLTASLVYAAANDYVEVRDMRLPVKGLTTLQIDDGSGSTDVSDVAQDFVVKDDGSGSIKFAGVQGRVEMPD